jgi:hypothetical protein
MTEEEWRACDDPCSMLGLLDGTASARKLRLFAVACCLDICDLFPTGVDRKLFDIAEQYANGELGLGVLELVNEYERSVGYGGHCVMAAHAAIHPVPLIAARNALLACSKMLSEHAVSAVAGHFVRGEPVFVLPKEEWDPTWLFAEEAAQLAANKRFAVLACDIFGNPFRSATFSADWRTSTAVALASQMYESRDFGAMPILADALQDAGCTNDDILNHCRDPKQVHVRGCWVVDLVLGKE